MKKHFQIINFCSLTVGHSFYCFQNLMASTLILSLLPFLVACCIKRRDIYFVDGSYLTNSTALSSSQTSHNPSLAIIRKGVFSLTSNSWISGMLLNPYLKIYNYYRLESQVAQSPCDGQLSSYSSMNYTATLRS